MLNLTFGEQVKIILSRKGMTIKELAEIIEERTGKKMSRQNLTQRLGRDNFQEQDMRMIADILGCPFQLSILADSESVERASNIETVPPTKKELSKLARAKERKEKRAKESEKARLADAMDQIPSEMEKEPSEKEMTLGDYLEIHEELQKQETAKLPKVSEEPVEETPAYEEPVYVDQAVQETAESSEVNAEEAAVEEVTEASGNEEPVGETEIPAYEEAAAPEAERTAIDDIESVMRELEELERSSSAKKEAEPVHTNREEKKSSGWRGMFQRRNKREEQERERREREQRERERLEAERREQLLAEEYGRYEEQPEEEAYASYTEPERTELYGRQTYEEPVYEEPAYEEPEDEEIDEDAEDLTKGEMNPYTNHEYETNSVRMHPKRIGYVQVYDRRDHAWTDMTEWAFLGYQERKKALLGKDYEPPIYLD
ncbi:MAG: hypothetical protein Q4B75_01705 [Eubacteriales bacterium]|nr:hypothetical protein [Eubacteriales bacterium]